MVDLRRIIGRDQVGILHEEQSLQGQGGSMRQLYGLKNRTTKVELLEHEASIQQWCKLIISCYTSLTPRETYRNTRTSVD